MNIREQAFEARLQMPNLILIQKLIQRVKKTATGSSERSIQNSK
jgi:hypothetical protein